MRACLAAIIVLITPASAQAEPVLRPGVAGAGMFTSGAASGGAIGSFGVGYSLEYEPLLLMPEGLVSVGGVGGDFNALAVRALGGFRGGVTAVVEPSLFLRGGFATTHLFGGGSTNTLIGGAIQPGIGLDYRSGRDLTFGGEILYDASFYPESGTTTTIHTVLIGGTVGFWL